MTTAIGESAGAVPRQFSLDAFRGFIMVVMALDHASFFIARIHPEEFWGVALPEYPDATAFLTRFITHLCAPGFFFLMGAGMVLYRDSRQRLGWSEGRITRHFVQRGLILLVIQQFIENPAWLIGLLSARIPVQTYIPDGGDPAEAMPGGGSDPMLVLTVLSALALVMIVCAGLLRLSSSLIALTSLATVVGTQLLTPGADQTETLYSPLARLLLIPGHTDRLVVIYPVLPWLGFAGLGLLFGRALLAGRWSPQRISLVAGGSLLLLFVAVRTTEFGSFHPVDGPGLIPFLNATKYPPSLSFFALTLGINGLILFLFLRSGDRFRRWGAPLAVFGKTALFFYLAHLYVYALIGLAFPTGTSYGVLYLVYLLGLALLFPMCRWYAAFKRGKAPDSIWRFF